MKITCQWIVRRYLLFYTQSSKLDTQRNADITVFITKIGFTRSELFDIHQRRMSLSAWNSCKIYSNFNLLNKYLRSLIFSFSNTGVFILRDTFKLFLRDLLNKIRRYYPFVVSRKVINQPEIQVAII